MAPQTSTQEFRNSTRLGLALVCAGLFILSLFPWFVTATHSVRESSRPALTESGLTRSLPQKIVTASEPKEPAEIALDYHPWQGDPATFLVLREDGSMKLVRYDRRQLDVWGHQEGILATSDVAEFFVKIRKTTFRRALRTRFARDQGADADFFYLGLRGASGEQGRWFSAAERAPRAVFLLVDKLLALNNKFKRMTPGSFDRYLRVDNLSAQDTKAVLKKGRPAEIDEFPLSVREVMGRAVSHPKEFFLITAEQAGELERARKPILQHARSLYDLQLFDSLLVPPGKPVIIKEPPNEDPYESLSSLRPPSRFDRPE